MLHYTTAVRVKDSKSSFSSIINLTQYMKNKSRNQAVKSCTIDYKSRILYRETHHEESAAAVAFEIAVAACVALDFDVADVVGAVDNVVVAGEVVVVACMLRVSWWSR